MAFDFLEDINFKDIGGALGGLGALGMAFKGRDQYKEMPGLRGALEAAGGARDYSRWAADPKSEAFRNLEGLFKETSRREAVQRSLKDILMQRRQRARGGGGMQSDRADEMRARNLIMADMMGRERARGQARDYLAAASQGQAGAASAYGGTLSQSAALSQAQRAEQMRGLGGLGEIAGALQDLFKNKPPTVVDTGGPLAAPPPNEWGGGGQPFIDWT